MSLIFAGCDRPPCPLPPGQGAGDFSTCTGISTSPVQNSHTNSRRISGATSPNPQFPIPNSQFLPAIRTFTPALAHSHILVPHQRHPFPTAPTTPSIPDQPRFKSESPVPSPSSFKSGVHSPSPGQHAFPAAGNPFFRHHSFPVRNHWRDQIAIVMGEFSAA